MFRRHWQLAGVNVIEFLDMSNEWYSNLACVAYSDKHASQGDLLQNALRSFLYSLKFSYFIFGVLFIVCDWNRSEKQ